MDNLRMLRRGPLFDLSPPITTSTFAGSYTHFIIINNVHLHKVHFHPQIAGASQGRQR